jgi:hypothetical protein
MGIACGSYIFLYTAQTNNDNLEKYFVTNVFDTHFAMTSDIESTLCTTIEKTGG